MECVLGEEAGPHIQGWVGFMVPITESDLSPGLQSRSRGERWWGSGGRWAEEERPVPHH